MVNSNLTLKVKVNDEMVFNEIISDKKISSNCDYTFNKVIDEDIWIEVITDSLIKKSYFEKRDVSNLLIISIIDKYDINDQNAQYFLADSTRKTIIRNIYMHSHPFSTN